MGKLIGRHEYSAWNYADPHTKSYEVLIADKRSRQITDRMHLASPEQEPRCLSCHAGLVSNEPADPRLANHASVGCESCHGAASLWLSPHTLGQGWREKYPEASKTLLNVTDLPALARSCVGCHIGAPPENGIGVRDVNHDMIAAGHPRLNFEFAGYLVQLPPHWNEKSRPRDPAFFARAWSIGQAVSAEAALKLLEYRARQPAWPELAEYACYACHHDLAGPGGWRSALKSRGELPWGSWYFAAVRAMAPESASAFDRVSAVLGRRPNADAAIKQTAALKPILTSIIEKGFSGTAADLRRRIATELKPAALRDWDGAAQLYLALAALSSDAERDRLRAWNELLRRPAEFRRTADFETPLRAAIDQR